MGTTIGRLGAIFGLGLVFAACSGTSKTNPANQNEQEACTPGERQCDGANVSKCNADGTAWEILQTCSAEQACDNAKCVDAIGGCVANTRFCKDGSVWKCNPSGDDSKLAQTCAKSQVCREADDSASCSDQACTSGAPMCDGDIATKCLADGSGPDKMGGTNCAANKQTCYEGACQDTACAPGMKVCKDGDVYLCSKNGSDMTLLVECPVGSVCDGEKLACARKICDVGTSGCDGTRAVKCNFFGSGWDPAATDCATDGQVCMDGACKKLTCTPNATFCQDGNVFRCDAQGINSMLSQTCYVGSSHCQPYPSSNYATCAGNQCAQDEIAQCFGNEVRLCNPDGSLAVSGTDCGADGYCENGACAKKVCEPDTTFCKDGDLYYCDWSGARSSLALECPSDSTCDANSYSCIPLPCSPGQTACLGNKVGKCAADGKTVSVTDDCTTSSSICSADNKCVKSVVDQIGDAEDPNTEAAGNLFGDVIKVTSARKLTELQMNLVLGSPRELRWVVFEQTADSSFTAKTETKVSNQSGSGYFSSGVLNFSLAAGKTYFVGLRILGGNASVNYLDTVPFTNDPSFGRLLGRVQSYYASPLFVTPDTQYAYQMKITTAP